jgi:hypothetical protein
MNMDERFKNEIAGGYKRKPGTFQESVGPRV